jgi:di/tricarboxylate transporter
MTTAMIITLIIALIMIVLIISDKLAFGAPPLIACVLLVLTGVSTIESAFGGFVDKNVIMIACFMIILSAFQKTSLITKVKDVMNSMASRGGYKNYVLMLIAVMLFANVISGTGYYVLVLSLAATIPYNKKLPVSKVLLPLGFATAFGGFIPISAAMMTGIVGSILESSGAPPTTISILSYSGVKGAMAIGFFVWALIGFKLLPDRPITNEGDALEASKEEVALIPKWKETCIYIALIVTVVGLILLSKLGDSGYMIPGAAAVFLLVTGCITFKEVREQISSPLVLMLAGVIGVANAMSSSGLTSLVGNAVADVLGNSASPFLIVLLFSALTSISACFTGASFGSLFIFAPIAISACMAMGYDPTAVALALTISAWINWFMPIDGLPAMIMGLGKYKLTEFWKFAVPLYIISILILSVVTPLLFPM